MVSLTEVTFDWNCFCGFCCFVIPVSIYQNLDLKGDHEKPLIPKFALRSLIFFLLIFCECQLWVQSSDILILQYEWDIWYLSIVTLSADVLVLVLGVVMETVNEYLIVNICCHRISYWHIFVCAICFWSVFWREELCLHSGKLTSGMLLRTRFLCRVLWRVLILS